MIRLMSRQIHKSNCLFDRTNVGGGEVEAPGGFDHGGEDEAGEGVGFGGGLVNAGQKPKCPASRDHLFVFFSCIVSLLQTLFTAVNLLDHLFTKYCKSSGIVQHLH